ncbi:hypothetical protein Vadar_009855 [Vaccinium darrowii]|uniref:Uncharacterized protein n=1 Tax=Vaccinium darrowii TaxID=229202 RepID=A0ACB7Z2S7_9ERIC|nr:hypothetical protein Vadar_009855 [Vaccinium darrowii]
MESDSKLMHLGADRLSSLPVELALRILARLPTKSVIVVVKTVKSWYNDRIWTSLPDLDFDQELIFHEKNNEDELTFCDFVDRILGLAVPPIHKFKLCADVEPEQIIGWIAEAVRLNPVEFHFDFFETVQLPDILLS